MSHYFCSAYFLPNKYVFAIFFSQIWIAYILCRFDMWVQMQAMICNIMGLNEWITYINNLAWKSTMLIIYEFMSILRLLIL
jgi:hypothetical protein